MLNRDELLEVDCCSIGHDKPRPGDKLYVHMPGFSKERGTGCQRI